MRRARTIPRSREAETTLTTAPQPKHTRRDIQQKEPQQRDTIIMKTNARKVRETRENFLIGFQRRKGSDNVGTNRGKKEVRKGRGTRGWRGAPERQRNMLCV